MSGHSTSEMIRAVADPLIAAGATVDEVRLAVWRELGIGIGGGGGGTSFGEPLPPPCPYCGATGVGGHGGLCPNGGAP